jgi:hypothetical protein
MMNDLKSASLTRSFTELWTTQSMTKEGLPAMTLEHADISNIAHLTFVFVFSRV